MIGEERCKKKKKKKEGRSQESIAADKGTVSTVRSASAVHRGLKV